MKSEIIADDSEERIDLFLADCSGMSRNRIQSLIKDGHITVGKNRVKPNYRIREGEVIEIDNPEPEEYSVEPEDIPIEIIYQDNGLCVVNKPQGMVVHPAPGNESGTLVNALLYHIHDLSSIGGIKRPGIVHRIDKMTSGLLVIAKNDHVHQALSTQFADHSAGREYIALVNGIFKEDSGTIDLPIGRHPVDRKKMAVTKDGKNAVTHWSVLERFGTHTLLRIVLETGRTHQIRVHMAYLKHPVAGDSVYSSGENKLGLRGQALHGYALHFWNPTLDQDMRFEVPMPEYMMNALKCLGFRGDSSSFIRKG